MNTSGYLKGDDANLFTRILDDKKYPYERRGNGFYIPGQYIIRNTDLFADQKQKGWLRLSKGEEVPFSFYKSVEQSLLGRIWCMLLNFLLFWKPKKNCRTRLKKIPGKRIRVRLLRLCHCCPLQLVQIEGDGDISDLLLSDALIAPGDGNQPQNAALGIEDQNQYAFSTMSSSSESEADQLIKIMTAAQQREAYNIKPIPVKVAVIDTGFREENFSGQSNILLVNMWNNEGVSNTCQINDDLVGWNFVGKPTITDAQAGITLQSNGQIVNTFENGDPDDDNSGQHGTLVSAIIAKKANPEIMVLKAFDSNGIGSMYTIVCALCYAETHDADVVNASFVVPSNNAISYLDDCLKQLEKNNVIVVCAAGNRMSINELMGVNLNTFTLYPACFSEKYTNIITVTTVYRNGENQLGAENFSERFVNVGVWADHPIGKESGYFNAPYQLPATWLGPVANGVRGIAGSSFATPIVTALVSEQINRYGGVSQLPGILTGNPDVRQALLALIPPTNGPTGLIKDDYYVNT